MIGIRRLALALFAALFVTSAIAAPAPPRAERVITFNSAHFQSWKLDRRIDDLQRPMKLTQLMQLRLSKAAVVDSGELSIVADGLTIEDWLQSGVNNNVEHSTARTNAFSTASSDQVTVTWTSHGKSNGDKFTIESGPTIDGLLMDGAWVVTNVTANTFRFTHTSTASGTTAGPTGNAIFSFTDYQDDGKLRFICSISHNNYDDMIKFPGVQGAAHNHTYFGNTVANYTSTYSTLRSGGDGTCDGGPLNRSAYWYPSMFNLDTDMLLYSESVQWYYLISLRRNLIDYTSPGCPGNLSDGRAMACPQQAIKRIRRGQNAIYGYDPTADGGAGDFPPSYPAGTTMLDDMWTCQNTSGTQQGGNYRYLSHTGTPSLGLASNVSCPSSGKVVARTLAPDCWNGQLDDDTDHYSQFTFGGQDGFGNVVCPATHPYRHNTFEIIVTWNYTGGFAQVGNWCLSSDRHNGATFQCGETWHWDMKFAWNDEILDFWSCNIQGMCPDPNDPLTYIFRAAGDEYAGGKGIRNTNNGGLGVVGITPCIWTGFTGSCSLLDHTTLSGYPWVSDTSIPIPDPP